MDRSGNAYIIDNLQAPVITLTPGRTYRFTNDNTGSHPLKFYYDANRTTLYETGVTFDNAYTEITVSDTTPAVLHYRCINHSLMGNSVITQSNPIVGAGITLNALGGGVHVTGVVTATTFKVGTAISITDGAVSATRFHGSGADLTGIAVAGLILTLPHLTIQLYSLDLSNAQDHKLIASGITTISCTGGVEGESHTVRITNSGITTIGFTTSFLFPSGATPSMPTADGAKSLISFTINQAGAAGTELFAGASLNFSLRRIGKWALQFLS